MPYPMLGPAQSRARVAALRRAGYHVERRRLPDGTIVVLRSRRPARRRRARENPRDKTLYWVLGGVGVLAAGGLVYYLATRKPTGGGERVPPPPAGSGVTPPPQPTQYAGGTQNPDFAKDMNQWFQGALAALKTFQVGTEMFNALYRSLQAVVANFGFLLPANPLPVF